MLLRWKMERMTTGDEIVCGQCPFVRECKMKGRQGLDATGSPAKCQVLMVGEGWVVMRTGTRNKRGIQILAQQSFQLKNGGAQ